MKSFKNSSAAALWNRLVKGAERKGARTTLVYSCLLALVVGLLAYNYLLAPAAAENAKRREALAALLEENAANRALEQTRPEFDMQYERAIKNYVRALELLPNDPELSIVLGSAQGAASRDQVQLTAFNTLTPQNKQGTPSPAADKLYARDVPSVVVGGLPQIRNFFEDVTQPPRIVQIKDVAMTATPPRTTAAFTLVAYNAPRPKDVPPIPERFRHLLPDPGQAASAPPAGPFTAMQATATQAPAKAGVAGRRDSAN